MVWSPTERRKRSSKCANPKGFTMKQFCKNVNTKSKKGERSNKGKASPKRVRRKTSPRKASPKRVRRKTSPRKASPKRVRRKTSPKRKLGRLNPPTEKDYYSLYRKKIISRSTLDGIKALRTEIIKNQNITREDKDKLLEKIREKENYLLLNLSEEEQIHREAVRRSPTRLSESFLNKRDTARRFVEDQISGIETDEGRVERLNQIEMNIRDNKERNREKDECRDLHRDYEIKKMIYDRDKSQEARREMLDALDTIRRKRDRCKHILELYSATMDVIRDERSGPEMRLLEREASLELEAARRR